jgi:RHS repeat-associated protein
LETETYINRTTFDALNRPIALHSPDNSIIRPGYNEANLLEKVDVSLRGATDNGQPDGQPVWTPFVANIDYDAKGQRTLIEYGSKDTGSNSHKIETTYSYDPETFRLVRLRTIRPHFSAVEQLLQDLSYSYDPAGNITHIHDDAQQTVFFNGVEVEAHNDYFYDAFYRLIQAQGREHIGQVAQPQSSWNDAFRVRQAHPHDGQLMRPYTERYLYDPVGNILTMSHQAQPFGIHADGSWTRSYAYDEESLVEPGKQSNRLSSTAVGSGPAQSYAYDAHGNMTRMSHLPLMRWDYRDQLLATAQQVVSNGGTPEIAYYVYDAAGQRVRKVTERQAQAGQTPVRKEERLYLGGFEIYRKYESDGETVELERETLHIMDDRQRIALVETRTQGNDPAPEQLTRYQLGNHLSSASLELDAQAQIISYEEYTPYGNTSYQAVRNQTETPKRYRYTGKERDEESGLYYYGARYYAAYLGRWVAVDPAGAVDGLNLYHFVKNNPILFRDPLGYSSEITREEELSDMCLSDGVCFESDTEASSQSQADTQLPEGADDRQGLADAFASRGAEIITKKFEDMGEAASHPLDTLRGAIDPRERAKSFDQSLHDLSRAWRAYGRARVYGDEEDVGTAMADISEKVLGVLPRPGKVKNKASKTPKKKESRRDVASDPSKGKIKASQTIGKPVEARIGNKKIVLRVDIEPNGKLQIQSGRGKGSLVDFRPDLSKPLAPQIDKAFKHLPKSARDELIKNAEKGLKILQDTGNM